MYVYYQNISFLTSIPTLKLQKRTTHSLHLSFQNWPFCSQILMSKAFFSLLKQKLFWLSTLKFSRVKTVHFLISKTQIAVSSTKCDPGGMSDLQSNSSMLTSISLFSKASSLVMFFIFSAPRFPLTAYNHVYQQSMNCPKLLTDISSYFCVHDHFTHEWPYLLIPEACSMLEIKKYVEFKYIAKLQCRFKKRITHSLFRQTDAKSL